MDDEKKLMLSAELLDEMEFEGTFFLETNSHIGVVNLSQWNGSAHILRIYQLLYSAEDEAYKPTQELAAFTFQERYELNQFLDDLPDINGIEMLILLNPLTNEEEPMNWYQ